MLFLAMILAAEVTAVTGCCYLPSPWLKTTSLLTRRQWRESEVVLLQAVAVRLGIHVPA